MFCSCDADGGLFWGGRRFSHTYFHVEMRTSLRSDSRKGRVCCGVCSGVWARDDGLSLSTGNATSNRSRRHALLCPAANEGVLHRGRCLRAASDCKYVPRYAWLKLCIAGKVQEGWRRRERQRGKKNRKIHENNQTRKKAELFISSGKSRGEAVEVVAHPRACGG